MEILEKIWFSGKDCIGIVLIKNDFDEIKAYIGVSDGFNEDVDAKNIASTGATFPLKWAYAMFPKYKPKPNGDNLDELSLENATWENIHAMSKTQLINFALNNALPVSHTYMEELSTENLRRLVIENCPHIEAMWDIDE